MHPPLNRICAASMIALLTACGGGGGGTPQAPLPNPVVVPPVQIDSAAYAEVAQGLYVTYFGRPATPAELSALSNSLGAGLAPKSLAGLEKVYDANPEVRRLVDAFALTKEWNDQYASTGYIGDDFTFVRAVHNNLFNRDPEIQAWEKLAGSIKYGGVSRSKAALSIAASAKGVDAELVAFKVRTARSFTATLASTGISKTYASPVEFAMARGMLQDIGSEPGSATGQSQLNAAVQALADLATGKFTEQQAAPRKIALLVGPDQAGVQASRLTTLATLMAADMNSRLGPRSAGWNFVVVPSASTAFKVREQLLDLDGAILIGDVPVPKHGNEPALDAYRLPRCKAIQFSDGASEIIPRKTVIEGDPACRNGLTISVLRGTSRARQTAEISRKLDQMIAYHRDSQQANAGWNQRYTLVDALWGGGTPSIDVSAFWDSIAMYSKVNNTTIASGSGAQRRNAFLECLSGNSEMCKANVHGAPDGVQFEGPGTSGIFYSSDTARLSSADLKSVQIKSKYVEMVSCSTQNFLEQDSFGTNLLMGGNALLTNGFVSVTLVADIYEGEEIRNKYFLLNAGVTFADAWLGDAEHGPAAFQGDPFITMRPVMAAGNRPVLVINGQHYNSGSAVVPVDLPDSLHARTSTKLIVLSNRGTADLHVRIDSVATKTTVDVAADNTLETEYGHNAQYDWGQMLALSDGRVEDPKVEGFGGRLPITLKPGSSVAYYYKLDVRTGADGKPKRPGTYSSEVQVLSNDPASARLHLALRTRVR